jgi:hypothetical protein
MKVLCRTVKNWRDPAQAIVPAGEFIPNGFGRRFMPHAQTPFSTAAFAAFGLNDIEPEPRFGTFIGNNYEDGAFVHEHTDQAPEGFAHVRCNWMVKKPTTGGDPILDGEVVLVEEGDLWLCIASVERHGTTPMFGGERLVFSFGALVKYEKMRHLFE